MVKNMNLTASQLEEACKKHPYILLRYMNGMQFAINSKVVPISKRTREFIPDKETNYVSYKPCSFQTYISYKIPFIT